MMDSGWCRVGVGALMALALWGCGETAGVDGGFQGSGGSGGGGGVSGSGEPGSLSGSVIDDQEWEAYLQRSEKEFAERETFVAPWTQHIPEAQSSQAVVTPDQVTLPNTTPGEADYEVGDILVSDNIEANKVFLRRVIEVYPQGSTTAYRTEDAAVTDVVYKGTLSEMPTGQAPGHVHQSQNLTLFQLLSRKVFPNLNTIQNIINGKWKYKVDGNHTLLFDLDIMKYVNFDNSKSGVEQFDASIEWSMLFGTKRINNLPVAGGAYTLDTSCEQVLDALDKIREVSDCQGFYDEWVSRGAPNLSGEYAFGTGTLPNVYSSTRNNNRDRGSKGLWVPKCKDPSSWLGYQYAMPYPEQTNWARQNCGGGALEKFDFVATFAPELTVSQADLSITLKQEQELGGNTENGLFENVSPSQRDELVKHGLEIADGKATLRFFAGWLPVVVTFNGKVVHVPFKVEGKGNLDVSVKNPLRASLDWRTEVHYNGGPIASSSSWDTSASRYTGDLQLPRMDDVTFESSGELSFTTELVKIELDVLLYDAAGLYFDGPSSYYGAKVAIPSVDHWRGSLDGAVGEDAQSCLLTLSTGVALAGGIKGKIPLTDIDADLQLVDLDSCSNGANLLCHQLCFDYIPLQVYASWDKPVDVDLFVIDPNGKEASYSTDNGIANASHRASRGCGTASTCNGPTYDEAVIWSSIPEGGSYTVRLKNNSDESASVTGFVRAQTLNSRIYIDEPIRVNLAPGQEWEQVVQVVPQR